jgi:hypothetical protein
VDGGVLDDYAADIWYCPSTDAEAPADADAGDSDSADAGGCTVNGVWYANGSSWEQGAGCPCIPANADSYPGACSHFSCTAGAVIDFDLETICPEDSGVTDADASGESGDTAVDAHSGQTSGSGN